MANDVTHNPLMLDTAGVISATAQYVIKKIVLTVGATAGDAQVRDGQNRVIAQLAATAEASDEINFVGDPLVVTGLDLESIAGTGARVDIYCG